MLLLLYKLPGDPKTQTHFQGQRGTAISMAASCTSDPLEEETVVMVEEGDDVVTKEEKEESEAEKSVSEEDSDGKDPSVKEMKNPAWTPYVYCSLGRETFHFIGYDITIFESFDFHGKVLWPSALALCQYLETNREQINLMDKYVLELGAGTGLVSIVAALLGAWVTATDLPEILGNLRYNLLKNTRGRCKYLPQVAKLSWSDDLDHTYPKSIYRYDYILATDVVYHHEFLDDLLVTMKHFCEPGTKLIWANKVRLPTDLLFTQKFKKTFNITFLTDVGGANIFMATFRDEGSESGIPDQKEKEGKTMEDQKCVYKDDEEVGEKEQKYKEEAKRDERKCHQEPQPQEKQPQSQEQSQPQEEQQPQSQEQSQPQEEQPQSQEQSQPQEEQQPQSQEDEQQEAWVEREIEGAEEKRAVETAGGTVEEEEEEEEEDEEVDEGRSRQSWEEQTLYHDDEGYVDDEETDNTGSRCSTVATDEDLIEEVPLDTKETGVQPEQKPSWAQTPTTRHGKDIYFYAGQEIGIHEGLDTYGAVMWPAALALCHFLETNPQDFNLKDKTVLELGAGTGIVSIVASLLGASATATDLPDIIVNLRSNLMRNTNGRSRHTPQVAELSWGHGLEVFFPKSVYRYDYVLAADVVYHHTFLKELLATMMYFCRPGTKLLWANKVRFSTDLNFTEDFKNTFHTTLLAELGVVKIFMATSRG